MFSTVVLSFVYSTYPFSYMLYKTSLSMNPLYIKTKLKKKTKQNYNNYPKIKSNY
jgi:hypothetical protein